MVRSWEVELQLQGFREWLWDKNNMEFPLRCKWDPPKSLDHRFICSFNQPLCSEYLQGFQNRKHVREWGNMWGWVGNSLVQTFQDSWIGSNSYTLCCRANARGASSSPWRAVSPDRWNSLQQLFQCENHLYLQQPVCFLKMHIVSPTYQISMCCIGVLEHAPPLISSPCNS